MLVNNIGLALKMMEYLLFRGQNLQESSLSLTNAKSVFSLIALQPRGDERPSHEALFRTILSLLTVHVVCNFDCEVMAAMQISASSVCPFDEIESRVSSLHLYPASRGFSLSWILTFMK